MRRRPQPPFQRAPPRVPSDVGGGWGQVASPVFKTEVGRLNSNPAVFRPLPAQFFAPGARPFWTAGTSLHLYRKSSRSRRASAAGFAFSSSRNALIRVPTACFRRLNFVEET